MKTESIPILPKRVRCAFCHRKFTVKRNMQVCTTTGLVVLACPDHAEMGDEAIMRIQMYVTMPMRHHMKERHENTN